MSELAGKGVNEQVGLILEWAAASDINVRGDSLAENEPSLARSAISSHRIELLRTKLGVILIDRITALETQKSSLENDLELAKSILKKLSAEISKQGTFVTYEQFLDFHTQDKGKNVKSYTGRAWNAVLDTYNAMHDPFGRFKNQKEAKGEFFSPQFFPVKVIKTVPDKGGKIDSSFAEIDLVTMEEFLLLLKKGEINLPKHLKRKFNPGIVKYWQDYIMSVKTL